MLEAFTQLLASVSRRLLSRHLLPRRLLSQHKMGINKMRKWKIKCAMEDAECM